LQNRQVAYTLRKSRRARHMRLAVYHDGSVVVTAPWFLDGSFAGRHVASEVERFIRDKTRWLLSKLAFYQQFAGRPVLRHSRREYLAHKARAYALISNKAEYFARELGYSYNRLVIKNQKTCWGSCSKKRNLNFNYKILFLPESMQNYIVVHELCHLAEFNHSKKFWTLVQAVVPNHRRIRMELKKFRLCSVW